MRRDHEDAASPRIRCRVSNEINAAVEFTAHDARSLRTGVETAVADYRAQHGDRWADCLVLQVRPTSALQASIGWWPPRRGLTDVQVSCRPRILARRPADDWGDIWEWVVAARGVDHAFEAFLPFVRDTIPDADEAPE